MGGASNKELKAGTPPPLTSRFIRINYIIKKKLSTFIYKVGGLGKLLSMISHYICVLVLCTLSRLAGGLFSDLKRFLSC